MEPPGSGRAVASRFSWLLQSAPVVVVTGPRGAGKKRFVESMVCGLPFWTVGSLEDLGFRSRLAQNPVGLLSSGSWVIHGAHLWPDLVGHVRASVDRRSRAPGHLVLTSALSMKEEVGRPEGLGSRAAFLELGPLTRRERAGKPEHGRWTELFQAPEERWGSVLEWGQGGRVDWDGAVREHGLPEGSWNASLSRALGEDLAAFTQVLAPERLLDLLRAVSQRTGELLNRAAVARAAGIPRPTAHRHLQLLGRAHCLRYLPPFLVKKEGTSVRTPRAHVVDPALALELTGAERPGKGHLEALLLNDLTAWRNSDAWPPQLYHWTTHGGTEVPFVLERNGRFIPVGVSLADRPLPREGRSISAFLDRMGPLAPGGLLIHVGTDTVRLAPKVWAAPWWRIV